MSCCISVIIAAYQVGLYIDQCIESVCKQTLRDIQIIIIDDGSTDGTGEICDTWGKLDERITVIHTENLGVSNARNIGIELADAEWLTFVDGDDYLDYDMLESFWREITSGNKYDIIIADYHLVDGKRTINEYFYPQKGEIKNKQQLIIDAMINHQGMGTNIGVPWGKLYNKQFLIRNSIKYEFGLRRMQDTVFNINAFYNSECTVYLHNALYNYRIRSESSVHAFSENFDEVICKLILLFRKYGHEYQLSDWDNIVSAKKLSLLVEWFRLVPSHKDCPYSYRKKIKLIKEHCNYLIDKNYRGYKKYVTPQKRIFHDLIEFRLYGMTYLLFNIYYKFK